MGSGETVKSPKHTGWGFSSSSPNPAIHSHHRLLSAKLSTVLVQGETSPSKTMFASCYIGCHCDYFGIILPAMISRSSLVGLRRSRKRPSWRKPACTRMSTGQRPRRVLSRNLGWVISSNSLHSLLLHAPIFKWEKHWTKSSWWTDIFVMLLEKPFLVSLLVVTMLS